MINEITRAALNGSVYLFILVGSRIGKDVAFVGNNDIRSDLKRGWNIHVAKSFRMGNAMD